VTPQELFDANRPLAYRVALRFARAWKNDCDRDALVNVCLYGLHRASLAFDAGRGLAFSTLATVSCRRAAIAELRRLRRWRLVPLSDDYDTPARPEAEPPAELPPAVREALARLPARTRAVLLARSEGETLEEAGRRFGVCKERARQLCRDAVRQVRAAVC
jgi:RNA polymerase sigma factor (sigma-70 family)